ncbi:hypothetical protein AB6A40_004094 [Gnathostoma spinigerum]|uniref:DNA mismatch repair protein n=1 Tax=Gnathostoma spinigerum TaxID=75299 RepID=A0ABD6EM74_9BILA
MSAKKQSSLLSFFKQSPKLNSPQSPGRRRTAKSLVPQFTSTPSRETGDPNEIPSSDTKRLHPLDFGDSPVRGGSVTKRRRIVMSSDSEEEVVNDENRFRKSSKSKLYDETAETMKSPFTSQKSSTPLSSQKFPSSPALQSEFDGERARSFVSSFQNFDDKNTSTTSLLNDSACSISTAKDNDMNETNHVGSQPELERFPHLDFDFLQPDKIRDASGRRPSDPEYCPRTLFVPESFLKQQTPGHRQWWTAKSAYFDTILFFKVGKFYEMYHMDAVIGVENLNLTYMRGKIAHCGFPEIGYGRFADQLLSRGYKVARVEQTETPSQLEDRNRKEKVKDKVVKREVCRMTSSGTRTYGVLDGNDDSNGLDSVDPTARYLLALCETEKCDESSFGFCFIDTSIGIFHLGNFVDDRGRSTLRTMLTHYPPCQILLEKFQITPATEAALNNTASTAQKEFLIAAKEYPTAESTLQLLSAKEYFDVNAAKWPKGLLEWLEIIDGIPKCKPEGAGCISALGAVIWYLKRCLIDVDMLTMRKFECYVPPTLLNVRTGNTETTGEGTASETYWDDRILVLDGISLHNLNIVSSSFKSRKQLSDPTASKYSLFNTINRCSTPFGKRLLHQWVCAPICDPKMLRQRQDAIVWLADPSCSEFLIQAKECLRALPDVERLLQKIHTFGLKYRRDAHPDGRAVMFEQIKYNRRKINDLLTVLEGFEKIRELSQLYRRNRSDDSPELLELCLGNYFPDITKDLEHFQRGFDHQKARRDGTIIPTRGTDAEYDQGLEEIQMCEQMLRQYLKEVQRELRCPSIKFIEEGKSRFHLEIPDSLTTSLSHNFELKSSRKGFKRYTTPESQRLLEQLVAAEVSLDNIRHDLMRRIFADFDSRHGLWSSAMKRVASFDVLVSFAVYSKTCGLSLCRPSFVYDVEKPVLFIKKGYHPCLSGEAARTFNSRATFIPNSVELGGSKPATILLTGPNMGGKSTIMRQVAVLVVLAQMGSLVPAQEMALSPVDRIFTRIGASDRISAGQSTFHVELTEANIILRNATQHSLVVMDELGRGTSTFDGTAIAYSVLRDLADRLRCRSFFSTHYHNLCSAVECDTNIRMMHMACVVENENEEDPTLENVSFLYTLVDGVCPKSYGFFAAKVSGIQHDVIRSAFVAARRIADRHVSLNSKLKSLKLSVENGMSLEDIRDAINAL